MTEATSAGGVSDEFKTQVTWKRMRRSPSGQRRQMLDDCVRTLAARCADVNAEKPRVSALIYPVCYPTV